MEKVVVMIYFNILVLSQYLPGDTEENFINHQTEQPASGPKSEYRT
jgi:hypothetical protein